MIVAYFVGVYPGSVISCGLFWDWGVDELMADVGFELLDGLGVLLVFCFFLL